jgi:ribonuclease VapC
VIHVFDSSALLAVVFSEPGNERVLQLLAEDGGCVSSVNWAETSSKMAERGVRPADVADELSHFPIEVIPLTAATALKAGELRTATRLLGLSLGDRCCFALAHSLSKARVVTADKAWKSVKGFDVHLIR